MPAPEAADADRRELTLRGVLLGAAITLVFTAANMYLGLKAGLTFASSIPAAVISMGVLRAFRNATIFENNIVQTVASAAGTLSSVIFVLPGLVMVGWWSGFPFWQSFGLCAIGGILGVMYSVPLRRALVTTSDLPYPEGVAAAEVLRVGSASREPASQERNRAGLLALVVGSVTSALFAAIVATRLFAQTLAAYARFGVAATGFGLNLELAFIGAGHLIGLSVGLAIFVGLLVAWGVATPLLTALHPAAGDAATVATHVWATKVRFIGAGTIGVSAIWTMGKLAKPVVSGVVGALAASRARAQGRGAALPRTERDIPIGLVAGISLVLMIPLALMLVAFLSGTALGAWMPVLVIGALLYVVAAGFLAAAACGYMAGLIGSSNSPVSGIGILAIVGASLVLIALVHGSGPSAAAALVAFALFVTTVLINIATISNDNLQDLKTGQLVDATPWRQQVALVIGVIFGSLVIPPILDLLNHSNGFVGAPNVRPGMQPFAAPQATLISQLAKGVIQGQIDWTLIGAGAIAGVLFIVLDEILSRTTNRKFHLPPLAVGLGIYLPATTTGPVVLGAVIGHFYNRWAARQKQPDEAKQIGVLLASGMIVGESLFGVLLSGIIVVTNNPTPLSVVGDNFAPWGVALGALAFAATVAGLYRWAARLSRSSAEVSR